MLEQVKNNSDVSDARQNERFSLRPDTPIAFISLAWRGYRRWRLRRIAIRHLETVDDYLLRDVGINRFDIHGVVNGALPRYQSASAGTLDRVRQTVPIAAGNEFRNAA
jgi:uncharacterized protein YjiS (DUF1127 family)